MSSTITFKWERNSDVPFPNVWSTFLAKAPNSDEFHEYEIRDLPVEQFDEAFDLFAAAYMPTEVTALAFGKSIKCVPNGRDVFEFSRFVFCNLYI